MKFNSEHFDAFKSPNYPHLAEAGVEISYNQIAIAKSSTKKLKVHTQLNNDIAVLHLFPGISKKITTAILNTTGVKAVILLTFGAGNATTKEWFTNELKAAIKRGIIIYNVTQCHQGRVVQGMYQTSSHLKQMGVVGGNDITFESAITKLMFLLGQKLPIEKIKKLLETNLRGEIA